MHKLALPIHLTVSELSFVLVALRPFEVSLAVHQVTGELALVGTAICIHCRTLSMLLIPGPTTLVLCDNTVLIRLA